MIKEVYFSIALAVFAPSVLIAAGSLLALRAAHRIYVEEHGRTSDSVYVTAQTFTLQVGHSEVRFYPRLWPAILILLGNALWLVGGIFLLFIRR